MEFPSEISVVNETPKAPDPAMTEPQRRCLLHILKNSAAALEGLVLLLEKREFDPTPRELEGFIRGVARSLARTQAALAAESFCSLTPEECAWVGPFVGCNGSPCSSCKEHKGSEANDGCSSTKI